MKKVLEEKFYNTFTILKKVIKRFPITILTILILTLIQVIAIDNDFFNFNILSNIMFFGTIFTISCFFIETIKENNKMVFYVITVVISLLFTHLANIESDFLGIENAMFIKKLTTLVFCYCISVTVMAIYFNFKKSDKLFGEYVANVFENIIKSTIIYGILAIGMAIITAIFILLILDGSNYTAIFRMEILILGFYYLPSIIYAFSNTNNEIGKFSKVVIKYVLEILVIIAFVIIYTYIAKIIILANMPSNQIFRILAGLFILGCPIWTMANSFKEKNFLDKINKKLPLLFIPFIILQIYSIGIRIMDNGITEARYLCIMLIIFEIIYTIIYLKDKNKVEKILIVFVILTIVSTVAPYINMFKVSQISQYSRLKIYKQKTEYTEKEENEIYGAYNYLKNSQGGEKYIDKLLNKEDIEKILSFRDIEYTKNEYIYASLNLENINVEGYKKLYFVEAYKYNLKDSEDIKNVEFNIEQTNKSISVDLSSEFISYIENENNIDRYLESNNEINVDNNIKIIIKNLSITYNESNKNVQTYRIEGYMLER